jgi:PAS domain S-box-containing protein
VNTISDRKTEEGGASQILSQEGDILLRRIRHGGFGGDSNSSITMLAASQRPGSNGLDRLAREYDLAKYLDPNWAIRPLEIAQEDGRAVLIFEDPGGELLSQLLDTPMGVERFLRLAVETTSAVGKMHQRGLVHKDIKPANILVSSRDGEVRLTGFGIASRVPRERQSPDPPEFIAGTLAYMAPEQTGRMNRSIDSRSDLYALGVTFYQMLTGGLPFNAIDAMEWIHCHIARQPAAPSNLVPAVPQAISAIVVKLLAKAAEDRYQTAVGLEHDLRRCLADWETLQRVDSFTLGERDVPGRLLIPGKLYGREHDIESLLAAFDDVLANGTPELVLVSGYSGVGKSAVVNELHKVLVLPRGLFASGKFDQHKRDIPYATLAQAFQSIVRQLLGESEAELSKWRDSLVQVLGPNGLLITDLIPELKFIVGEQPPVPELPLQEAKVRFQLVFRRFIGVFARPEHPLALFLDDLQWLDAATLDLIEDLLAQSDVRHLLLIGAYRDNEVGPAHPLTRTLEGLHAIGAKIQDIALRPLTLNDVACLVSDSLRCEQEHISSLASLVFEKTGGNPFFTIQFISELEEEGLLTFEPIAATWRWNVDRIHAKGYTANVVDLMVGKLSRLPNTTQEFLKQLACMGNSTEFELLRKMCDDSEGEMHNQLWEAVRAGLIFRSENSYRFLHDRVQEAAYFLIPEQQRAQTHLRIGRILAENTPQERLEEVIFDIVNQLNRGSPLIVDVGERERAADLNLIAGKRAKASTAYASALKYLHAGCSLLNEEAWERNYDLIFSIESLIAECKLLTADMVAAEGRLTMLAQRARSRHDFAVVTRLQITLYTTLDRSDRAIEVFLNYLRRNGTDWSPHPARNDVMQEYNQIWSLVGNRQIENLVDLPLLDDPDVLDMLDVFTEIVHPAMFFDENLSTLVVFRMVSLCLEHGNCDASCFGYVWFGMFAGPRFNNYADGFRFGQLGYDLVEKRNLTRYQARTYTSFGTLTPWAKHAAKGRELIRRAFDVAYRTGDLTFSAYSWHSLIANYLAVGDPLSEVQSEVERGLNFVKKAGFGLVIENCRVNLGLIRTLRGLTSTFGCFDAHDYNESDTEHRFASNPALALAEFFYWTRKLQARFFAGDYGSAVEASQKAHQLLWPAASQVETGDFRFYAALAHAAAWNSASAEERQEHFDALKDHHRQLEIWALHCPANFETKTALVSAEIARIEGRMLDAEHFYEAAICSAHDNGFLHCEAVANECAAQFYSARNLAKIAHVYFREARDCYLRWGADAKVRQLEEWYPQIKAEKTSSYAGTMHASVEQLDLATVIRVSEEISGEIEQERLIDILMRLAIEHAGAERGVLLLSRGSELRQEAEAITSGDGIIVRRPHGYATPIPETVVQYVVRAREIVILDDALTHATYSADSYIVGHKARSVLCLPLVKESRTIGVLYLENNLTPRVFTPNRAVVLKLLASQAAISLENTYLYSDLAQAERALSESERNLQLIIDTIPALVWSTRADGSVEFINQHYCDYVGLPPEQLLHWGWTSAVHPDDLRGLETAWREVMASGKGGEAEARFRRSDGEYRWLLARVNPLHDGNGNIVKWYGLNTDIDERKRAEQKALEAERELQRTIDSIPALAATYNANGSRISVNKLARDFTGLSAEDVTIGRWSMAVHPDDIEPAESKWAACIASGEPFEHEYRTRAADGTFRWHVARRVPLRDETGKVIRWYGVSHDIEDRKRAEAHLAGEKHVLEMIASGRPLRDILEALCQFFEGAAIDCFCGIYPIDGRGWTFQYGVAPSLPASYTDPIEGLPVDSDDSPRGQSISERTQVVAEDIGSDPRWMEAPCRSHVLEHGLRAVWSTPISSGDEKVIGTVCVYQRKAGSPSLYHQELIAHVARLASIAIERSQAEAALRRSETFLAEGQRISLTGSCSWMLDTDEFTFSDQLRRIFEFEPDVEVTFARIAERVHPDDLPIVAEKMEQARSGQDYPEFEFRLRMPDGRTKYVRVFGRIIRHEDGRLECLGAGQDVTRRRLAEETRDKVRTELAHVSRVVSLGALTASIAHEVNQPLASIVTNGETGLRWLVRPEPNLAKVEDLIKRVVNDARRAAEIIDRTRTMAGRGSTKQSAIMLAEIITESAAFLQHEFQARGVSVSLNLAPDLPAVFGDRTQLQQVVVNLVVNAVQAPTMSEAAGKSIAIRTQKIDAETVCCIVEDSGPGIDAEHLPRLFDSFFTTKETGMGLGLPIAQSIIEAHNGRIVADNNSSLGGARFVFYLPVIQV